ncbi:MAG: DUF5685 family protein [Gemmiger sp.]
MFGYVTIYRKDLPQQALDCYQGYYCGLCQALGQKYGVFGRMTLSYDMTFTALLLSALYEPADVHSYGRCVPHPLKARPRIHNEFVDYAADLGIALAYYNFMDDWNDEQKSQSHRMAQRLAPFLAGIEERHPVQCTAIRERLAELTELENADSDDLDALCGCFGKLLGAVFDCRGDLWGPVLQAVGRGMGGFIYLMDAYDDLDKDRRNGSFNALAPLAASLSADEYEKQVHELLTQQMALCAQSFEMLPILKETPEGQLLYNTIYSGVWCQYAKTNALHTKHREGKQTHA